MQIDRCPVGITPAGAGKTADAAPSDTFSGDHPRGCGENQFSNVQKRLGRGSPPRVRGKPDSYIDNADTLRITPAGAGKTGS